MHRRVGMSAGGTSLFFVVIAVNAGAGSKTVRLDDDLLARAEELTGSKNDPL